MQLMNPALYGKNNWLANTDVFMVHGIGLGDKAEDGRHAREKRGLSKINWTAWVVFLCLSMPTTNCCSVLEQLFFLCMS